MVSVEQGPTGAVRQVEPEDLANRRVGKIVFTPSYASVAYTGRYDAELVAAEISRAGYRIVGLVNTATMYHDFCAGLQSCLPGVRFVDATDFVDDLIEGPTDLATPAIWHDAIRADEVTAIDDRHERRDARIRRHGLIVVGKLGEVSVGFVEFRDDLDQPIELGRTKEQIDVGEAFAQLRLLAGDHAAGEGDAYIRIRALDAGKGADLADDLVLSRLSNDAGVQNDDIRLILNLSPVVSDLAEHRFDLGGLGFVHLATDRPDAILLLSGIRWCFPGRFRRSTNEMNRLHADPPNDIRAPPGARPAIILSLSSVNLTYLSATMSPPHDISNRTHVRAQKVRMKLRVRTE